jgi:hypothetical protein
LLILLESEVPAAKRMQLASGAAASVGPGSSMFDILSAEPEAATATKQELSAGYSPPD